MIVSIIVDISHYRIGVADDLFYFCDPDVYILFPLKDLAQREKYCWVQFWQ